MATDKERLDALEERIIQNEAGSITLLGIVREVNDKVDGLIGSTRSLQAHEMIVDARLSTVDARLSTVEAKLGAVESKIDQVLTILKQGE